MQTHSLEKRKSLEMDGGYDKIYPCAEQLTVNTRPVHANHDKFSKQKLDAGKNW